MRNWKNWLAPILTCLTVVALALLPWRLSILRDESLTGAVHAEELAEDSNFPAKPPEPAKRIWLLLQETEMPDALTIMNRELEGASLEQARIQLAAELDSLAAEDILPMELAPSSTAELFVYKTYLRDQTDLASASFIHLDVYDKSPREYRSLVLDGESGRLLSLEIDSYLVTKADLDPAELGAAFLDRLGLAYELVSQDGSFSACFRLTDDPRILYWVIWNRASLSIRPFIDWETLDGANPLSKSLMEAMGLSVAVSGYDS